MNEDFTGELVHVADYTPTEHVGNVVSPMLSPHHTEKGLYTWSVVWLDDMLRTFDNNRLIFARNQMIICGQAPIL